MSRTLSFRIILLGLVLGLILASTISTAWIATAGFRTVVARLTEKQMSTTLDAVNAQVEALFAPTDRLLRTFSTRIQAGALPTDDPRRLAEAFAEGLAFERRVGWISFGYADGAFAGAREEDGGVVINLSRPGAGAPREWRWEPGGGGQAVTNPHLPPTFDAREREWFRRALAAGGPVWMPPYAFATGERGITVAQAVRTTGGDLLGVLTVDFRLADVAGYLDLLKEKFEGDTLVFSLRGNVIAQADGVASPAAVNRLRELLAAEAARGPEAASDRATTRELTVDGNRYLVGWKRVNVPGDLECVSAMIIDRRTAFGPIETVVARSAVGAGIALLVSLGAGYLLASRIATPLRGMAAQVARIGDFDLRRARVGDRSTIREVRVLSEAVERMRAGIESFSRYVPVDLVRDLIRQGDAAELGGERRVITVFFSDLAGFTMFAERHSPEVAVETLSRYFEVFAGEIDAGGGVVGSFIGDGILALFDAPVTIPAPEAAACRTALRGLAAYRQRAGIAPGDALDVRIGLTRGEALVGNVGTHERFAYTAIGDCVNLGSRLEGLNKRYGTSILASSAVREAAGETEFLWRHLDRVPVPGYREPVDVHELMAFRAEATPAQRELAADYAAALAQASERRWDEAERTLGAWRDRDPASRALAERIARDRAAS